MDELAVEVGKPPEPLQLLAGVRNGQRGARLTENLSIVQVLFDTSGRVLGDGGFIGAAACFKKTWWQAELHPLMAPVVQ